MAMNSAQNKCKKAAVACPMHFTEKLFYKLSQCTLSPWSNLHFNMHEGKL